jgi:hypothetical protein
MTASSDTLEATTKPSPKAGGKVAKKKPGPGRPPATNPKRNKLAIRLDDGVMSAWEAYLDSTSPRVSTTSALTAAILLFLETKGFYPPKKPRA